MNDRIDDVRHAFLAEMDRLFREEAFATVGEMFVFVCLDGESSVQQFDRVLNYMRAVLPMQRGRLRASGSKSETRSDRPMLRLGRQYCGTASEADRCRLNSSR